MVGGQYQRLVLHLTKEASASAGDTPSVTKVAGEQRPPSESTTVTPLIATSPPAEAPSTARTVLKWSAAGLAGVGVVVGVVATIEHGKNVSAFDSHTPSGCFDNNGMAVHANDSPAPECQGSLDSYRSDKTWAVVGFAGAGAFAVTWLILQLTEGSPPAAVEHALAAPLCAPSSSGVGVGCAFRF
jgi:hypothetical protein